MGHNQTCLLIIILVACLSCLPSLFGADDDICGIPVIPTYNSLSHGGAGVLRGQFPWIVAYHETFLSGREQFLCSGTLLSSKNFLIYVNFDKTSCMVIFTDNHVVTAAHCIHEKSTSRPRLPINAVFYIGKNSCAPTFCDPFSLLPSRSFFPM